MDERKSAPIVEMLEAVRVDDVDPVLVGPGCLRRDLPDTDDLRAWMVDMASGSVWPVVDEHDMGEVVHVVEGEVIGDERRFGAGTRLCFRPGSRHRPRTEKGARLFGINPRSEA